MDEQKIRQMKVQELQEELKKKKLDTSGKKAKLVERLVAYLTEQKGSMNTSTVPSHSKNKSKDHTPSMNTSTSVTKEKRERNEKEEEDKDTKSHSKKQKIDQLKEEEQQQQQKNDDKQEQVTETIRIDHFRRPFTLPAVKKLVQELDEYVGDGFWMNSIKTHCYVTYKTTQAAVAAKKLLHGKVWPVDTGLALSVSFSTLKANEVTNSTQSTNTSVTNDQKSLKDTTSHSGKKSTTSSISIDMFFQKTETLPKLYYLPVDERIAQERKKLLALQQKPIEQRLRRERSNSSTAATIDSTSVAPSVISSSRYS